MSSVETRNTELYEALQPETPLAVIPCRIFKLQFPRYQASPGQCKQAGLAQQGSDLTSMSRTGGYPSTLPLTLQNLIGSTFQLKCQGMCIITLAQRLTLCIKQLKSLLHLTSMSWTGGYPSTLPLTRQNLIGSTFQSKCQGNVYNYTFFRG